MILTSTVVCLDMAGKQLVFMIFLAGMFLGSAVTIFGLLLTDEDDPFNMYDAETWRN